MRFLWSSANDSDVETAHGPAAQSVTTDAQLPICIDNSSFSPSTALREVTDPWCLLFLLLASGGYVFVFVHCVLHGDLECFWNCEVSSDMCRHWICDIICVVFGLGRPLLGCAVLAAVVSYVQISFLQFDLHRLVAANLCLLAAGPLLCGLYLTGIVHWVMGLESNLVGWNIFGGAVLISIGLVFAIFTSQVGRFIELAGGCFVVPSKCFRMTPALKLLPFLHAAMGLSISVASLVGEVLLLSLVRPDSTLSLVQCVCRGLCDRALVPRRRHEQGSK